MEVDFFYIFSKVKFRITQSANKIIIVATSINCHLTINDHSIKPMSCPAVKLTPKFWKCDEGKFRQSRTFLAVGAKNWQKA